MTVTSLPLPGKMCHVSVLPDDVLLYLFGMMTHADTAPPLASIAFTHVSSAWRAIAMSAPTLWTRISTVDDLNCPLERFERTLSNVSSYLERSRNLPLVIDISIRSYHNGAPMTSPDHPFIFNAKRFRYYTHCLSGLLSGHLARFKKFTLVADEFESVMDVQYLFPHLAMPLLESLRVWSRDDFQCLQGNLRNVAHVDALSLPLRPHDMTMADGVAMYPNLTQMTLKGIPLRWNYFCPTNLRYLHISFLPMEARPTGQVLKEILLANEHCLEALKIQGACPIQHLEVTPYVMSNLKSLEISFTFPEEVIPFIASMQVPNLLSLSLTDLRRKFVEADLRHLIEYDYMTLVLFQEAMKYLPLHQIAQCHLSHIFFLPSLDSLGQYPPIKLSLNPGFDDYPVPKILLRFLRKMDNLRYLIISDPDPSILRCLNFARRLENGGNDSGETRSSVPLPSLDHLHIADFHLPNMQEFVVRRADNAALVRRLDDLLLSMPVAWGDPFAHRLHELADNVEIFGTVMDADAERALLVPLPY